MLESPFPQWVRDQLKEVLDGYVEALPLIEERCEAITKAGRKNAARRPCDDIGTVNEYRNDGKYCAGQAVRLRALLEGRTPPTEWEKSESREIPMDPRKLAAWAWQNKLQNVQPVPAPEEAKILRLKDFMHKFTQREAHALILTEACGLKAKEAAMEMGITERTVQGLLASARKRFGPNEEKPHK